MEAVNMDVVTIRVVKTGSQPTEVLFFESDERCETSYRDKKGKYQDQPPPPPSFFLRNMSTIGLFLRIAAPPVGLA